MTSPHPPAHSRISPTAKLVAYWRQFSDIPYAAEVARLVDAEGTVRELLGGSGLVPETIAWGAPLIEARYKAVRKAIRSRGFRQVLELASGIALRGLAMTDEDPELVYIETDLPGITEEKRQLLGQLGRFIPRGKVFFEAVNVLSRDELMAAARHFDGRPCAVVHEGLFQYLTLEERWRVASHIRELFEHHGGAWITPDFTTKREYKERIQRNEQTRVLTERVTGVTERDLYALAFDDEAHVSRFLVEAGFRVEVTPQIDGTFPLTAAQRLAVPQSLIDRYGDSLQLWTMTSI